ncbi:hypothetical protein [Nocardioides sp. B-3]|uniref:hypothetical protein n=1 Tax=Nocardioides sp. B-3 TaxID=2895565 RepID=UPI0021531CF1|nr:hypothetical protein [Nocardioides sp. B-3]UUZ60925.1 hypothetical protein LP418_09580 [Nocardioides sp. B-3]
MPSEYRVAPAVAARLMGGLLIAISVLVFVTTGLVAFLDLHTALLLIPAVLGICASAAGALVLARRGWVVRFTDDGYRVQWVRGVGVATARWKDVEDAGTTTSAGSPVVVLRLRSGGSTTIPVEMLAGDREEFVRDLLGHLRRGQGLRQL